MFRFLLINCKKNVIKTGLQCGQKLYKLKLNNILSLAQIPPYCALG